MSVLLLSVFIIGCSSDKNVENAKPLVLKKEELTTSHISQDSGDYTHLVADSTEEQNQSKYENSYFKAWHILNSEDVAKNVEWAFDSYNASNGYGENLQALSQNFFEEMKSNANFKDYFTLNQKAVTLKEVNLRAFPTDRPLLLDPSRAGEGFPFDYLQNSTVHANKPIFATHYSSDKEWVHVFSSFAFGWVKVNEIVFLEKRELELWQKAQQVFIIKDDVPIYSLDGDFLFKSKLGMMFALISEDADTYSVLAISSYAGSKPLFVKANIDKDIAHKGFVAFNGENIKRVVNELLKSNYGWGGMYGQRDCSSTIRDMFAPFGVWLPRNSYKQSLVGEVVNLDGLSDEEKIVKIKEKAMPFKTLFYKKGHIMLFTGIFNDEITVFQNVWGVKTKKDEIEGRFIIGKTIFSTLKLGSELTHYDQNASVLSNLKSMNILF